MFFTAVCGSIFSLLADMPRDYYPNSLEGKNGAELKTELHNLLKNHTRLPYGSRDYNQIACTWTVFKKSDVRPNKKVWDMYSNNSYNFPNGAGATKGMNIEHSVPKSWWGDAYDETATPLTRFKYDGSYDLHHLPMPMPTWPKAIIHWERSILLCSTMVLPKWEPDKPTVEQPTYLSPQTNTKATSPACIYTS